MHYVAVKLYFEQYCILSRALQQTEFKKHVCVINKRATVLIGFVTILNAGSNRGHRARDSNRWVEK